jgi:hypothetical protein
MATGIHKYGEEFFITQNPQVTMDIFLFDDTSESNWDESSDVGDLTTEPNQTGSGYSRQSVSFTASVANGSDWYLNAANTVSFANLGSFTASKVVTAYGAAYSFSYDGGPGGDHIVFTGSLSQSRNLQDFDQLNVDNIGGEIDDDGGTF